MLSSPHKHLMNTYCVLSLETATGQRRWAEARPCLPKACSLVNTHTQPQKVPPSLCLGEAMCFLSACLNLVSQPVTCQPVVTCYLTASRGSSWSPGFPRVPERRRQSLCMAAQTSPGTAFLPPFMAEIQKAVTVSSPEMRATWTTDS